MRYLGLDYGAKRWGLSYGDELGLALPLPPAIAAGAAERFAQVAREIAARKITELVVGYPYNMDGTAGLRRGRSMLLSPSWKSVSGCRCTARTSA